MDKKTNPTFMFVVILSIMITAFAMFILFAQFNMVFYIVIFVVIFFFFWMFFAIAKNMTNGAWEEKLSRRINCPHCQASVYADSLYCPKCGKEIKHTVQCDYCGHDNPPGLIQCEECKGLL